MKKSLIALAVLATAGTAFAQSSVTLSGGIATEYSRLETAGGAALKGDDGNTSFALSGTEDLGGGLKATVYMQQRFNSTTGITANSTGVEVQNIYVGLSGAFGAVIAGRFQPSSLSGYDAFGGWNNGTTYAASYKGGTRTNNLIQYSTPTISGFALTVATSNTAGSAKEYTYIQAKYSNGPISLAVLRDELSDGAENVSVGASYDFGVAKVMATNGKATTAANVSKSNTTIGVQYPMGAMTFKASVRSGDDANATAIGVDYALSKRTGLYAAAASHTGGAQTAFRLGIKHSF